MGMRFSQRVGPQMERTSWDTVCLCISVGGEKQGKC